VATGNSDRSRGGGHRSGGRGRRPATGDALRQLIVDAATERITEQAVRQADKVIAKAARHAEALDRLAAQLDALDLWTRDEPGRRRPRLSRDEIAAAAVYIADAEGFDALSMRRLAAELDAGTMTLYHYVRTKDELLTLVTDAVLGEVVVPPDEPLPDDWREAVTVIARRTRDALRRHPWILEIADDPAIGPNSVRHFDQTLQAVASLDIDLEVKLDVLHAIDEYVFGFCMHERSSVHEDEATADQMTAYVVELVASGEFPEVARLIDAEGSASLWSQIQANAHDPDRFDRNLSRLLDGFEHDLHHR
jgi:AcrR family transcriptional regulator